ncbi:helix-turn-helix transcriptional regulator [Nostoc sp. FACHB-87]|uniref:helix-turn-helix domain-containing protein n=1 Tax=Nostocaceae TaxID=1162 RepID=UPI00168341EA|nr:MULTISPECIES: helix-turn-helix domain-containing protein [Nostocaceae]MBD2458851.1 helix-turn-helix transcriptional regulator [Nostoc sp. FACHB-87]MBD2479844.1 helix-turn-helix transcriptional regulator [Anabaena sp. FACHB-83]
MDKHQEILIVAVKESGLTAREISVRAGVHESTLSKFLEGKSDVKAGNYFKILNALPEKSRIPALARIGVVELTPVQLIEAATPREKAEILQAIAAWVLQPGAIPVKNTDTSDLQVAV